jgi:crossover junction endodeoxyribonuclease RuvC
MNTTPQNKCLLGIDPGTNILGYAILNVSGQNLQIGALGVLKLSQFKDHSLKLKEIFLQLQEVIEQFQPTEMAIEAPFFGKNVQSMLKLGRAQGVSMAAAYTMGLDVTEYSPKKIKQSVTGNGNASKEQVCSMLGNILNVKLVDEYLDATDALATAVCHHYQTRNPLNKNKKFKDWSSFIKSNQNRIS